MKTSAFEYIVYGAWIFPLIVFLIQAFFKSLKELHIYRISAWGYGIQCIFLALLSIYVFKNSKSELFLKGYVLYTSKDYEFYLAFFITKYSMLWMWTGTLLSAIITLFSKYYLHRESGYKRFFTSIHLFYLGFILICISGNLETLFIGWEIIGICSFLLIAFYRTRYLPVHNALKVFTIYRLGDIGLLLCMWGIHHAWHSNVNFYNIAILPPVHSSNQMLIQFSIMMLLLSAMAKSAIYPFTTWLPRAMEGPTPSSAISYGALSVHMGIFLLIKTHSLWQFNIGFKITLCVFGIITAIVSTLISNTQSTIKGRIAYATAAQVGIMCITLSFDGIAFTIWHMCGHALLRTYQLLHSASIVSLKNQEFKNEKQTLKNITTKFSVFKSTVYTLALKEFNMDLFQYNYFWKPLKSIGRYINIKTWSSYFYTLIPMLSIGFINIYNPQSLPLTLQWYLPVILSGFGLALILKAFSATHNLKLIMILILSNHVFVTLAVLSNDNIQASELLYYWIGIALGFGICFFVLHYILKNNTQLQILHYNGLVHFYPNAAFLFLMGCLMLSGFPICTTFIGEDLIFSHIKPNQITLVLILSLGFILDGLALIRMYARIFLGPIALHNQLNSYKRA
jgi:NADH-quinone oxidoreductase subunit L